MDTAPPCRWLLLLSRPAAQITRAFDSHFYPDRLQKGLKRHELMSIPVDSLRSCMLTLAEECGTHSGLAPGRLGMVPSHKALAHSFALLHIGDLQRFCLADGLSAFS